MSICSSCRQYYRLSKFHQGYQCEDCTAVISDSFDIEESDVDIQLMMNPSGKTMPCIEDDSTNSQ